MGICFRERRVVDFNFKKLAKICMSCEKLFRIYTGATKLKYQAQDFLSSQVLNGKVGTCQKYGNF